VFVFFKESSTHIVICMFRRTRNENDRLSTWNPSELKVSINYVRVL